jgi:lysophospholipase L1-like esterase
MVRPSANPDQANHFPALDLLTAHVAALPDNVQLVFVFAPPYLNTLPVAGSAAESRLQACKTRVREIAARRMNAGYLDLMAENAISHDERNYFDELHYTPAAADQVAEAIVEVLKQHGLTKR